jgi:hypothetical protein
VRGAAKNRHAYFHNTGRRLQCDAVSASGSGKEQGAAEKVLRHTPPWTPIHPDRHNLARCHFDQSHPWRIAGIGGSLTLTGPDYAIASYWAAKRCDRRIRPSNNRCEHPAHGTTCVAQRFLEPLDVPRSATLRISGFRRCFGLLRHYEF